MKIRLEDWASRNFSPAPARADNPARAWIDKHFHEFVFTRQQILDMSMPYDWWTRDGQHISGVYFLITENADSRNIAYVGKSNDICTRLQQHRFKPFQRYADIPVPELYAKCVEAFYIQVIRPAWNGDMPGSGFADKYRDVFLGECQE